MNGVCPEAPPVCGGVARGGQGSGRAQANVVNFTVVHTALVAAAHGDTLVAHHTHVVH